MVDPTAEKIIKRKGIGAIQDNSCQDGDFVSKALSLNLKIRELGLRGKPKTRDEMQDRITEYFSLCQEAQLTPTVEGLALAINYDRRTLFDIQNAKTKIQFTDIVKEAKDFIAGYDAILAASNKMNSAVYCFRSKNFYGMKDTVQIESNFNQSGDMPKDANGILEELPEAPAIEVEKAE